MLKTTDGRVPVRTLKDYLSQKRTLVIPPWQREYSWKTGDEGQVDVLLSDLLKFVNDEKADEYLIGSVILCNAEDFHGKESSLLIDGQQRTLTLTLFLMCARKYLKNYNLIDGTNNAHTTLITESLQCLDENPFGTYTPKVFMNQGRANEIFAEIYDWSELSTDIGEDIFLSADTQTLTQRNLSEVAKHIYEQLKDEAWEDRNLIKWLTKIIHKVKLVELQLDNQREAIAVYDRINDRGMQLSSADLIKNILFQRVPDESFEEISDNWKTMTESLNQCKKKVRLQDPKYLLRALAATKKGIKITYDDLVPFWNGQFDHKDSPLDPEIFSKDLAGSADFLAKLADNSSQQHGAIPQIFLSAELGSVQHYPVLLAGSNIKNKDVFTRLADQVNTRTMFYVLGKERTASFESLVPAWAHAVSELGSDATIQDLNAVFQEHAMPPNDLYENLEAQFRKWDYRNASDRKKIRAVLAYLSGHLDHACGKELKIQDAMRTRRLRGQKFGWDLDHVLPQDLEKEMPFQSIGNLVLLTPDDNREASNKTPDKKDIWYNQCHLVLTKSLSDLSRLTPAHRAKLEELFKELHIDQSKLSLETWGKDSISERTSFYFKYFKSILDSYIR